MLNPLSAPSGGQATKQHLREVLCVGSARVGLDRDDGVAGVVLAGEERVLLQARQLGLHRLERGLDLGGHVPVHGEELSRVVVLATQALVAVEPLGNASVLAGDRGRALLVVPEAGLAHLRLELGGAYC